MTGDVPAQRGPDGCTPAYVADVDQALAIIAADRAAHPRTAQRVGTTPRPSPAIAATPASLWAAAWRGVRSGVLTVAALAGIAVVGVQGAAVLVDWWAPTASPSACADVVLPIGVVLVVLAVLGLAGAVVREISDGRRRRSP